jgi:phosphoribosylformimino-5-aminoimidazole carboxamide ribotide isomerase
VRLVQGDAARETVYSDDPVHVATRFASAGARWLHVVDLDGAFSGSRVHTAVIRGIVESTDLSVELGGGIRTMDDIELYLTSGVSRVVLGTAAHNNPQFVHDAVARYGSAIAVGIDARGGKVAVRGWTEQTETTVVELAQRAADAGITTLIYTDISVDGMLTGPDLATLKVLLETVPAAIIASGGVACIEHVRQLCGLTPRRPAGCIIGKAIYTGDILLERAIAEAGAQQIRPNNLRS